MRHNTLSVRPVNTLYFRPTPCDTTRYQPVLLTPDTFGPRHATQHAISLCPLSCRLLLFYFYQKYIYIYIYISFLLSFSLDCPLLLLDQTISLMKFESQWRKEQSGDERNYPSVCCKDLCYIMDVSCRKWIIVSMVITAASSLPPDQWGCQKDTVGWTCRPSLWTWNKKQHDTLIRNGTLTWHQFDLLDVLRQVKMNALYGGHVTSYKILNR
jgi:hypothetical protein